MTNAKLCGRQGPAVILLAAMILDLGALVPRAPRAFAEGITSPHSCVTVFRMKVTGTEEAMGSGIVQYRTLMFGASSLRLRGGGDSDRSFNGGMLDEDVEDRKWDSDDDMERVLVTVRNTCFDRNDVFNISVDPDMLITDLKRELYANHSAEMCEPEQMEIEFAGMQLKGVLHDTLRSYGFSSERPERIRVRTAFLHSESVSRKQARSGLGMGGQQDEAAAMQNARMQVLNLLALLAQKYNY